MDFQITTTIRAYTDRPGQKPIFNRNQLSGFVASNSFQTSNQTSANVLLSSLSNTDILAAFAAGVASENVSMILIGIEPQSDGTVANGNFFTVKVGATIGSAVNVATGSFFQLIGGLAVGNKVFVSGTGSARVNILIYSNPTT